MALSEYVGKVTGLEVNEGMLGRAMEKTATLKNVSITQGDITEMPFPDDHFDAICCNLVSTATILSNADHAVFCLCVFPSRQGPIELPIKCVPMKSLEWA